MLNVEWKTGIGYGDFVTGLGYAHTSSLKYQIPVSILFHWSHSESYLFSDTDPETIVDRFKYIHSILKPNPLVEVSHKFNSNPSFRFFNQLDEFNPLHGLWYSTLPKEKTERLVVLWTTEQNLTFPGTFKDPVNKDWYKVRLYLENAGYNVIEVTYRTPIAELMSLINRCEFGIGYDGLAHQLFKFMWKPLIVFCKRTGLNQLLVPQAALLDNVDSFLQSNITDLVEKSNQKIKLIKRNHQAYMSDWSRLSKNKFYNQYIY